MFKKLFSLVTNGLGTKSSAKKLNKAIAKKLPVDSSLRKGNKVDEVTQQVVLREERLTKRIVAVLGLVIAVLAAKFSDTPFVMAIVSFMDPEMLALIGSLVVGVLGIRWEYNALRIDREAGFSEDDDT